MAVYRQVQTNYWHDSFVMELTPEERYFYIYLLTNSETTQSGIFEIHKRMMEMDLGYNRETIEKLIKRFEDYGKIIYSKETREIMIINWMKYNFINSRNTILCINKELKEVKNINFLNSLYKICLSKGYDVETIFEGVILNREEKTKVEDINNGFSNDDRENQDLHRGLEGASKDLGEEQTKEETEIKEQTQKKSSKDNSNKVLLEFNKNIRQATIRDVEKIILWLKEFEEEVVIEAIMQAVKYKGVHTGYIESVLKNWKTLGLFTMEKLKDHKSRRTQEKKDKRCNADAYKYLD